MAKVSSSRRSVQARLRASLRRELKRRGDNAPFVSVYRNSAICGGVNIKVVSKVFSKMLISKRYAILKLMDLKHAFRSVDFNRVIRVELLAPSERLVTVWMH
jgi:hypothetical protein